MPPSLLALVLAVAVATPVPKPTIYNGRLRHVDARPPRLDSAITVDGRLDEAVWQQAAVLTGFSQFSPTDGIAGEDSTEVLVWYSARAIHFGIRAFEQHDKIRATLAQRDKIDADDYVQLLIGTFNDGRQATLFGVNPLGVQQDGIITETGALRGGSGFGSAGSVREAPDLNPDFVFFSKGRLTDWGYEVEVTIPFKTLRFQPLQEQSWRLQVIRKIQHNGHEEVWAPALRASASFLTQSGRLSGLTEMRRGLVLDLTPEVAMHSTGAPSPPSPGGVSGGGSWHYTTDRPTVGANVRWGISENLTANGTVHPDFSQVEADALQLSFDPRRAVSYPEKRPFFLEGTEQFSVPSQLVYTRDIVQPDAAIKLSGKVAGTNVAALTALDGTVYSRTGSRPLFNVLRAQRDLGTSSRLGLALTDVEDGGTYSRVADIDTRIVWDRIWSLQAQYAQSYNRLGAGETTAPLWSARLDRNARNLSLRYQANAVGDDFATRAGFVARAGIGHMQLSSRYTFFGRRGGLVESLAPDAFLDGTWTYASFRRLGDVQDLKWHFGLTGALRGGWQLNGALLVETFGYDSTLYTNYRIDRPRAGGGRDTVRFTGTPHLPNFDYQLVASTPQFRRWDANVSVIWGKDENFYEWSSGDVVIGTYTVNLRPSEHFRVNAIYKLQSYVRRTDGSTVALLRVPRLKVEYQLTRSIFFRYVGQYEASKTDSLRDDSRTNAPILLCTAASCRRSTATSSNVFRGDWLFSYQPVPGTVLFLGYGSTQTATEPLRFSGLRKTGDGLFLKGSWLYRM